LSVSELVVFIRDRQSNARAPEWKDFIKIAGFDGGRLSDCADVQFVVLFGMFFGPVNQKIIMKEEPEGRVDGEWQEVAEGRIEIRVAKPADVKYVYPILKEMEASARVRGTGIAKRTPQSLCQKIYEGRAVIAVGEDGSWAGFSYIEAWGNGEFVSNSGLIVNPVYRGKGVARGIKEETVQLCRSMYPTAKIFSITTGAAVMKLNHEFGFRPVTYAEITRDERFWDKCRSCVNYPVLQAQGRQRCLCTAMLFSPDGVGEQGVSRRVAARALPI
jgi:N-acetylglutamate synthase-like GNAT family acetyltransferase